MQKAAYLHSNRQKNIVLWGANELLSLLICKYEEIYGSQNFVIIDSDPSKTIFLSKYPILTPEAGLERIVDGELFVIAPTIYYDDIVNTVHALRKEALYNSPEFITILEPARKPSLLAGML